MTEIDYRYKDALSEFKNIAVVGASRAPEKPAHYVPNYFSEKGYNIIPVNPKAKELFGNKCFKSLSDIKEDVEIINIFRPAKDAEKIVEEALKRHKDKGDIKLIWLQEGITSKKAKKLCEKAGLDYFEDRCMYTEYVKILPERE